MGLFILTHNCIEISPSCGEESLGSEALDHVVVECERHGPLEAGERSPYRRRGCDDASFGRIDLVQGYPRQEVLNGNQLFCVVGRRDCFNEGFLDLKRLF